jgi:hypothetical protein
VFADPRSIVAWGPPNASRARAVDAIRQRLSAGPLDGRTLPCARSGRHVAAHPPRPAHGPHAAISGRRGTLLDTWRTIGPRGTASDSYCVHELFVSEALSTTREDPTLRRERGPLYAFTMQGLPGMCCDDQ